MRQWSAIFILKRKILQSIAYLEQYVSKTQKVSREDLYELSYCYYQSKQYKNVSMVLRNWVVNRTR